MTDEPITGIYELLDAIEAVIIAADPAKREVMATIDGASREKGESKSRVIRLVDRKPEGSA
jgi:hypothetical protein